MSVETFADRGALTAASQVVAEESFRRFAAWCDVNGLRALPAQEQTVLRFFHAHHPDWSYRYVKRLRAALKNAFESRGHDAPFTDRTTAYLSQLRLNAGAAPARVDPVRVSDLAPIAASTQQAGEAPSPQTLRIRVLLSLIRSSRHDLSVRDLASIRRTDIDLRTRQAVITVATRRLVIDAVRDPGAWTSLTTLLDLSESTTPFVHTDLTKWMTEHPEASDNAAMHNAVTALRAKMHENWSRAGLPGQFEPEMVRRLPANDFAWLLAMADKHLARRRRDLAYVLVGVFCARRHLDLARLRIEDVSHYGTAGCSDRGLNVIQRKTKTDLEGRDPITLNVPHVSAADCPPECPACALSLHLETQARVGRDQGLIFGTFYAGSEREMTRQNGARLIRELWKQAGLDPDKVIASRSLRAGGATSAAEAGMPLWEIASELTHHKTLESARAYIRAYDPWRFQAPLEQ